MTIDAKILNKGLVNQIQQCSKRILCHEQVGLTPGMQDWFKHSKSMSVIHNTNRLKKENHMSISINTKKEYNKIQQ